MSGVDIRKELPSGVAGGADDATEPLRSLWLLEQDQWVALSSEENTRFYRDVLDAGAFMTIPSPYEIMMKDRVLREVAAGTEVVLARVEEPRTLLLSTDSAVLIYVITQQREGQEAFTAAINSTYRRFDEGWRMVYHQQTPIDLRAS